MLNPFSTSKGKLLAEQLIREVCKNEPIQNYDECIDYVRQGLCNQSDKKAGAPVSALIMAEDFYRLNAQMSEKRYKVSIGGVV